MSGDCFAQIDRATTGSRSAPHLLLVPVTSAMNIVMALLDVEVITVTLQRWTVPVKVCSVMILRLVPAKARNLILR